MDIIAGICELIGLYLIGSRNKKGFLINLICNILWVFVAWKTKVFGLLLVVIPAMFINVKNYMIWRQNENKLEKN